MGEKGVTHRWRFSRKLVAFMVVAILAVGFLAVITPSQTAQAALTPTQKQALAEKYCPIYIFNAQEDCYPVRADYAVQTSSLYLSTGASGQLVRTAGNYTLNDLGTTYKDNPSYYLQNIYGDMHNSSRIISAYQQYERTSGYAVYAHVIEGTGSSAGKVCIQYWTFYVFNDGKFNDHVGDWEMTQVIISASKPAEVGFSQHNSGESASWDVVEKDGDHYKVYVAQGSHANYFRYFQGLTGMAKDVVQGNGKVLAAGKYNVTLIGDKGSSADPAWINFAGRWGNWGEFQDDFLGQRGPPGPGWRVTSSTFYYDGFNLQSQIPTQNPNMFYADMYFYYQAYFYALLFVIPVVFFFFRWRKKKRKGELKPPYLHIINIKGFNLRSIGNILAIVGIIIGVASAFFPYYTAQANVQSLGFSSDQFQDVVIISGSTGVQINAIDPQMGMTQLASFPIPFGILICLTIFTFLLGLVAVTEAKAGRKYLWRGFKFALPLIITIIAVVSLNGVASSFIPGPGVDATTTIIADMAKAPLGGSTTINVAPFGPIQFRWSMGMGGYLMILAAAFMLLAGFLQFFHREKPKPVQQPPYQAPQQYQQQYQQPPQQQPYQPGGNQGGYQQPPPQNPPQYPGPPQRPPSP